MRTQMTVNKLKTTTSGLNVTILYLSVGELIIFQAAVSEIVFDRFLGKRFVFILVIIFIILKAYTLFKVISIVNNVSI